MESTGTLARNKSTMGEESSDFDILINMQKYRSSPALAKLSTVSKADEMNLQHVSQIEIWESSRDQASIKLSKKMQMLQLNVWSQYKC